MQHLVNTWITLYWHKNVLECTVYIPFRCVCFKRASEMSAALHSLQAPCDLRAACSITCQNKCTCFQWFSPLEAVLAIYSWLSRCLMITDHLQPLQQRMQSGKTIGVDFCSGNQRSVDPSNVPINRQNRYIGRPLITSFSAVYVNLRHNQLFTRILAKTGILT